jgi:hypothetical protein
VPERPGPHLVERRAECRARWVPAHAQRFEAPRRQGFSVLHPELAVVDLRRRRRVILGGAQAQAQAQAHAAHVACLVLGVWVHAKETVARARGRRHRVGWFATGRRFQWSLGGRGPSRRARRRGEGEGGGGWGDGVCVPTLTDIQRLLQRRGPSRGVGHAQRTLPPVHRQGQDTAQHLDASRSAPRSASTAIHAAASCRHTCNTGTQTPQQRGTGPVTG